MYTYVINKEAFFKVHTLFQVEKVILSLDTTDILCELLEYASQQPSII